MGPQASGGMLGADKPILQQWESMKFEMTAGETAWQLDFIHCGNETKTFVCPPHTQKYSMYIQKQNASINAQSQDTSTNDILTNEHFAHLCTTSQSIILAGSSM